MGKRSCPFCHASMCRICVERKLDYHWLESHWKKSVEREYTCGTTTKDGRLIKVGNQCEVASVIFNHLIANKELPTY